MISIHTPNMSDKQFISANQLLANSFKLANNILQSAFQPDLIIGVWRGGAPIAIAVHEYFDHHGYQAEHIAIKTSLYNDIDQRKQSAEVLWLENRKTELQQAKKILIVDDVFDTGKSMLAIYQALHDLLGENHNNEIKSACPWYKPSRNTTAITPDYYLHKTEQWLVFPHELCGLSELEIQQNKPLT